MTIPSFHLSKSSRPFSLTLCIQTCWHSFRMSRISRIRTPLSTSMNTVVSSLDSPSTRLSSLDWALLSPLSVIYSQHSSQWGCFKYKSNHSISPSKTFQWLPVLLRVEVRVLTKTCHPPCSLPSPDTSLTCSPVSLPLSATPASFPFPQWVRHAPATRLLQTRSLWLAGFSMGTILNTLLNNATRAALPNSLPSYLTQQLCFLTTPVII